MVGGFAAIDIPMCVGLGVCRGPCRDRSEQQLQSVVWLDLTKIGAMLAQVAKEFSIRCGDSLAYDGDADAASGIWRRGGVGAQAISVGSCAVAKVIHLMGGPKIGGQLFDKGGGVIDPIELFQFGGDRNLREALEALLQLRCG